MSSPAQTLAAAIREEAPRSMRVLLRLQPDDAAALDQFAAQSDLTRGEACRALVRHALQLAASEHQKPLERMASLREALTADLLASVRHCSTAEGLECHRLDLEKLRDGLKLEFAQLDHALDLIEEEISLLGEAGNLERITEEIDRLAEEVA